MRLLACLLALGFAACQHADSAERSAEITAQHPAVAPAPAPAPVLTQTAEAHHGCGCGTSPSSCNGSCGGQCGGESPELVAPASATWTTLHVAGMHCGGCARRIERALAGVQGVLGVKADFQGAKVEVATAAGVDARHLVQPTIDGLGYQVQ
jgi:copper chaperone CopZ